MGTRHARREPGLVAETLVAPVLLLGPGIIAAEDATLAYWQSPDFLDGYIHIHVSDATTRVAIGTGSVINNGVKLLAEGPGIEVGRHVLVGRNTEIYDSDRHQLDPGRRDDGTPKMGQVAIDDTCSSAAMRAVVAIRAGSL